MSIVGVCILCDYYGPKEKHKCKYPNSADRYVFTSEGKYYRVNEPSLPTGTIARIMDRMDAFGSYMMFQYVDGVETQLNMYNSVDLTKSPEIYFVPHATTRGGWR